MRSNRMASAAAISIAAVSTGIMSSTLLADGIIVISKICADPGPCTTPDPVRWTPFVEPCSLPAAYICCSNVRAGWFGLRRNGTYASICCPLTTPNFYTYATWDGDSKASLTCVTAPIPCDPAGFEPCD